MAANEAPMLRDTHTPVVPQHRTRLVRTMKPGDRIRIGEDVEIVFAWTDRGNPRLIIEAPASVRIEHTQEERR